MNGGIVQSALRELTRIAGSRNLWLTFAAVVLLFVLTGPFGTLEQLRFLPRLGYWLVLHGLAWSAALAFAVLGDLLLKDLIARMLWRMMIGSIVAAIPIGVITQAMQWAWFGHLPTAISIAADMLFAVPLCIIFCVIAYMTMSNEAIVGKPEARIEDVTYPPVSAAAAAIPEPAPIMRRLKLENRGPLLHLSVEDHYTMVTTSRGRELILLRFSDAVSEVGRTAGLQVHRSHWVADGFVKSVNRTNGKLTLLLSDGAEIPVSRTYAAEVRARFG